MMTVLLVGGFLFAGLIMLNGCAKEEPVPEANDANTAVHDHDHGEGEHSHEHSETAMATDAAMEIAETEQTTCPVMDGNPINKAYFTEYQGKKVYFCCPGCDVKFKADPEKYLAKLPQFNL